MKTDNLNQPGERTHGVVRGHVGRGRAGTPGQTYRDGSGVVAIEVSDLTFSTGTITDNDDGTAVYTPGAGTGYTQAEADDLFLTRRDGEGHEVVTTAASGAAVTLDVSAANVFDITLTANCTLTISNPPAAGVAGKIIVILRQGGVGSFTVTWPGSVDWQDTDGTTGGAAPTLFTAVGAQDDIELATLDGGVTWGGSRAASSGTPATTVTDETTLGISPAVGTDTEYARQDHTHGTPSAVVIGAAIAGHAHVAFETHLSNGSSGAYTLDEAFETGSVIAWNTTTIARLTVAETQPDQVTVSPVGTSGDSIVFDYAATLV